MSSLEDSLTKLRKDIESLTLTKAKADVAYESAKQREAAIREKLKEKFGISTVEEAQGMLIELRAKLEELIERAQSKLREVDE